MNVYKDDIIISISAFYCKYIVIYSIINDNIISKKLPLRIISKVVFPISSSFLCDHLAHLADILPIDCWIRHSHSHVKEINDRHVNQP